MSQTTARSANPALSNSSTSRMSMRAGCCAAGPLGGGSGECHAAITALVYCATQQPGLLIAGSLDGIVHVWR